MRSATKLYAWLTVLAVLLLSRSAFAIPTGHILRIDPRAGVSAGAPLITTVIETVQFKPMSEVITTAGCGKVNGDAVLDCISNALEAKNQLWTAFAFPDPGSRLLVRVDGADQPATLDSKATWAASTKDPLVGTAWLIALDASSGMAGRYADAREVANQFIAALGPNDVAKLVIFDDRVAPYVANSQWVPAAQKASLIAMLTANPGTSPSHQQARPLFSQVQGIAQSFGDLGNAGTTVQVPYHQAMVFLSNGAGREDASNTAVTADAMKNFFNNGRFPANNPLAPKTPLPVIAVYFPNAHGFTNDQFATSDMQFMEDLANPEIGGFFDIVRTGQGVSKATAILTNIKARYNGMWVVKWRLSCLAPTPAQTFNLIFTGTGANAIQPDGSFSDVPIGVDPTSWPLDINLAQTKQDAETNPIHPGGTFRIYGNFCWAGDKTRAEVYFVPAGTNPNQGINQNDPNQAKAVMQQLVARNLHGTATEASAQYVTLNVPDSDELLEGEGDNTVAHLVLYDNKAQRASGVTAATVITLKATKKPFNLPVILGAAGIVVVILLLVVVLLRGGGGGKGKKGGNPPPAPIVAGGPGYGAPPGGGYGGPPAGGGYGAPPGGGYGGPPQGGGGYGAQANLGAYGAAPIALDPPTAPVAYAPAPLMAPSPPPQLPPQPPSLLGGGYPLASAGGAPVEVRCPACSMVTMAMPGQASICFSCGQPLPKDIATSVMAQPPAMSAVVAAPQAAVPAYPLTSAQQARSLAPPPSPYATPPTSATIVGAAGSFAIKSGIEVHVGRDPAACPIMLNEPRVSGVHATLKFEAGLLLVRDEGSNNGTYVGGLRIPARVWTPVGSGPSSLRFGPVEFAVRIE